MKNLLDDSNTSTKVLSILLHTVRNVGFTA